MQKQIITALASFGMSGQVFHGPCLKINPHFHVKKILERSKNLSASLFPEARIVRHFEEILSDPEIELVIVNTPDRYHYEMTKAALLAGKHVVVEKPFTETVEQASELIELATAKERMLTVYQNRRWDSDFMTVKKVIDEGLLGQIVEFESHFDRYRNFIQTDTWKEEAGENTGVLYNLGVHMIDQALFLFGRPKSVTAHLHILRKEGQVTDYYDIRLQYPYHAAIMKCSYLVREPGPKYMVHGTQGSFLKYGIDLQEDALKAGLLPEGDNWGKEPESEWGILHTEKNGEIIRQKTESVAGNYPVFYQKVYEAIRNGKALPVRAEEALLTQEIMELCKQSHHEQKTIFLP